MRNYAILTRWKEVGRQKWAEEEREREKVNTEKISLHNLKESRIRAASFIYFFNFRMFYVYIAYFLKSSENVAKENKKS